MATLNRFREQWLRYHKRYERRAFKELRKVFKTWGKSIEWDNMTLFNYSDVLSKAIDKEQMFEAYMNIYTTIGRIHGKRVFKKADSVKFFNLDDFPTIFQEFVRNWLMANKIEDITTVSDTYKKELIRIIVDGINNSRTMQDISRDLQKVVNKPSFYRWQAMRIARTETTNSANLATLKAAEQSRFKQRKVWISATDARTRRLPQDKYDHIAMHGKEIGLYDMFEVPNTEFGFKGQLLYPGDPNGRAGNIINCRCTIGIVAETDSDGLPILK